MRWTSRDLRVVSIFDLGVSATLFDYGDDESEKEAILRELALVARAYLDGAGRVYKKRGLRSHPVLTITVNGREWKLGRRRVWCTTHRFLDP